MVLLACRAAGKHSCLNIDQPYSGFNADDLPPSQKFPRDT
jgi:hypothetical protein